ncbi:uncharacterized protein KY384_000731 [Bacidia gigantensis]|uniref:uncharacterized protein n=1 Tax=Bacidia gigantensis TaxID=2732470 RepID=UPI001D052B9A|nr:uncharacterized protein KY384_000731 [Bacidia gigantensis]KAG8525969.1 hypothetical protein KY384_000731 [Bacidia gigantensis]
MARVKPILSFSPLQGGHAKKQRHDGRKSPRVGAPPALSPSQRRKLIRLYFLTNMTLEDICRVISFHSRPVQKRTVQNTLHDLLRVRYDRMRAKDVVARRRRVSQILACSSETAVKRHDDAFLKTSEPYISQRLAPDESHFGSELSPTLSTFCADGSSTSGSLSTDLPSPSTAPSPFNELNYGWMPGVELHGTTSGDHFDYVPAQHQFSSLGQNPTLCFDTSAQPPAQIISVDPMLPFITDPEHLEKLVNPLKRPAPQVFDGVSAKLSTSFFLPGTRFEDTDLDSLNLADLFRPETYTMLEDAPTEPVTAESYEAPAFNGVMSGLTVLDTEKPADEQTHSNTAMASSTIERLSGKATNTSTRNRISTSSSRLSSLIIRFSAYSLSHKQDMLEILRHSLCSISSTRTSFSLLRKPVVQVEGNPTRGIPDSLSKWMAHSCSAKEHEPNMPIILFKSCGISLSAAANATCIQSPNILHGRNFARSYCWDAISCGLGSGADTAHATVHATIFYEKRGATYYLPIRWQDRFGNTRLHLAAAIGADYKFLQSLIEQGESINAVNTFGQSFMHVIVPGPGVSNLTSFLNWLGSKGFNFSTRDLQGQTYMHECLKQARHIEASSPLPSGLYRDNSSFTLKKASSTSTTQHFLSSIYGTVKPGVDLDRVFTDKDDLKHVHRQISSAISMVYSRTKLYELIESRASDVIAYPHDLHGLKLRNLARSTTDPNQYDSYGLTTMMNYIARSRSSEQEDGVMIETLILAGADVEFRNSFGATALHIAVVDGNIGATKALLKYEANVHARTFQGHGVLALAADARSRSQDESLYARITLCMALIIDAGAVANPTYLQEWSLRSLQNTGPIDVCGCTIDEEVLQDDPPPVIWWEPPFLPDFTKPTGELVRQPKYKILVRRRDPASPVLETAFSRLKTQADMAITEQYKKASVDFLEKGTSREWEWGHYRLGLAAPAEKSMSNAAARFHLVMLQQGFETTVG